MTTTVDFVADFGAPTNGTSDSCSAFAALDTYMQTHNDVVLTVPAHTYKIIANTVFFANSAGASKLVVQATGASFITNGVASYWLGGGTNAAGASGLINDNAHSARFSSVNAGASSITMLSALSLSVGQWVLLGAYDMAGFGFPINPFTFEYAKVLSIVGLKVTFTARLKYSYSSIWPNYDPGTSGSIDQGGPATIYALSENWDIDVEYVGLTIDNGAGQIGAPCRSIKLTSCKCTSSTGIIPSQNQIHTWDGCDFSACGVEVDKIVEVFSYGNGTSVGQLNFQSASITSCVGFEGLNGGATVVNTHNGTGRYSNINGATLAALWLGPSGYGRCDSFQISNSIFTSISLLHSAQETDIAASSITLDASGVITVPNTYPGKTARWATPGGRLILFGNVSPSGKDETEVNVLGVTYDGTNTRVQTDAFGAYNLPGSGIAAHPAPIFTCINCTGCPDAIDLSQPGAWGKPIGSYSNRTYTGADSGTMLGLSTCPGVTVRGNIVSVKVTVSQAYTGTQSSLLADIFNPLRRLAPDGTISTWGPIIDLKTAGTRIITATAVTGAVGADNIPVPGLVRFAQAQQLTTNHDVSGEASGLWPIVTIEVQADQGFPASTARTFLCKFV